ncbi:hypothetical protein ACSLBF_19710 (plasmid) [Pseudoalteromonas sp. T1lg65]|uniref:hypothetical protein n=1 Tax=Pseudoalteromonas sp. T1lg65 TaxID=2077101 RepID=UPI003F7A889B
MDFYILKKQEEFVAIPANEQCCKEYLDEGYFYVDKVAACNEKSAIRSVQEKHNKVFKVPAKVVLFVIPIMLFAWWSVTH